MKNFIIITFHLFLFFITGCDIEKKNLNLTDDYYLNIKHSSESGKYLSASYSISKGDVFSASKIFRSQKEDQTLLDLKLFSNIVSGNFEAAETILNIIEKREENDFLFNITQFAINFKKGNYETSLLIAQKNNRSHDFNKISSLLEYWMSLSELKMQNKLTNYDINNFQIPLYKLLVLENFYDIDQLLKIANYNFNLNSLSNIDLLFLAGFYLRLNDIKKFEEIIINRLPNNFNKDYILKNFYSVNNIFYKKANFQTIFSSYLYNIAYNSNDQNETSSYYVKIFLEMSLYFCSNMDISKYSLAELYTIEKSYDIAFKKLNTIEIESFFSLASNLKKISILKDLDKNEDYQKLLFEQKNKLPNNKLILYELANFYKSQNNYKKALAIYKQLISNGNPNNRLLLLYAICLDKLDRWDESKQVLLNILKKNASDTYSLNYLAYSMAIRKQDLDFALSLIKKALKVEPDNAFFLDTLGWVQFQRKDYNSSLFFLEKAITLEPTSSEILDHLGDCYLMLGRINEAKYEWKKALQYENKVDLLNIIKKKINQYE
jgi:Flp pilus assembly protein TadD